MNIKFIAQLTGAAGFGAAWAWAITADRAEVRARKMAEDYIAVVESVQELTSEKVYLSQQLQSAHDRIDNLEHRLMPDEEAPTLDNGASLKEVALATPEVEEEREPTEEEIEVQRTELQNLIAPYIDSPEVQAEFAEQAKVAIDSANERPPFIISASDYAHDEEGEDYAKHTIHYYGKHQTLLDEIDEAVPQAEVERYVGWRNLRQFGELSNQPDVVFVRNHRMETDFEVVLLEDEDLPMHVQYNMSQPEFETMKNSGKLMLPGGGDDDG